MNLTGSRQTNSFPLQQLYMSSSLLLASVFPSSVLEVGLTLTFTRGSPRVTIQDKLRVCSTSILDGPRPVALALIRISLSVSSGVLQLRISRTRVPLYHVLCKTRAGMVCYGRCTGQFCGIETLWVVPVFVMFARQALEISRYLYVSHLSINTPSPHSDLSSMN